MRIRLVLKTGKTGPARDVLNVRHVRHVRHVRRRVTSRQRLSIAYETQAPGAQ